MASPLPKAKAPDSAKYGPSRRELRHGHRAVKARDQPHELGCQGRTLTRSSPKRSTRRRTSRRWQRVSTACALARLAQTRHKRCANLDRRPQLRPKLVRHSQTLPRIWESDPGAVRTRDLRFRNWAQGVGLWRARVGRPPEGKPLGSQSQGRDRAGQGRPHGPRVVAQIRHMLTCWNPTADAERGGGRSGCQR